MRAHRSKKDRPCDACRTRKQACEIVKRDDPCRGCARRKITCSFDIAPLVTETRTKRRRESTEMEHVDHSDTAHVHEPVLDRLVVPEYPPASETSGSSSRPPRRSIATALLESRYHATSASAVETAGDDDVDHHAASLDLAVNDLTESHFIGSSAFLDFVASNEAERSLADMFEHPRNNHGSDTLPRSSHSFRQVSRSGAPAFFVRNPAFFYGRGTTGADEVYRALTDLRGQLQMDALADRFMTRTLPAYPIINRDRLHAAVNRMPEAGPYPSALLAGMCAHATVYFPPDRRVHFKEMWRRVSSLLDEEYKQPKLQTLQLALIDLITRPNNAHAQNCISLSRAVGLANLLGLHMDCSDWRLPKWEIAIRKRIWWGLYIHDKWHALMYGRPWYISSDNATVPLPSVNDMDPGAHTQDDVLSMQSFVLLCRVTVLLDEVIRTFLSAAAVSRPPEIGLAERSIEAIGADLDYIEVSMPLTLTDAPAGIRSLQLTFIGMRLLLLRVGLGIADHRDPPGQLVKRLGIIMDEVDGLIDFILGLTYTEAQSFWTPYSSYILSFAVSLLIRSALKLKHLPAHIELNRAVDTMVRLVHAIRHTSDTLEWEIAESAWPRCSVVIKSVVELLPELGSLVDDDGLGDPIEGLFFDLFDIDAFSSLDTWIADQWA